MRRFTSIVDSISTWSAKGFSVLILAMTGVVILEVILRYGFNSPTVWAIELVSYISAYVYLIGGAYVLHLNEHVRVDVIYARLRPRTKAILDLVTSLLFFAFCAVLIWKGGEWMWEALIGGKTSGTPWDILVFPRRLAIPLAAFLLFMQGVVKSIRDVRTAISGEEAG
jgi:TRAP-type mannitol/chloroaromatic compound transport system permease small subunit